MIFNYKNYLKYLIDSYYDLVSEDTYFNDPDESERYLGMSESEKYDELSVYFDQLFENAFDNDPYFKSLNVSDRHNLINKLLYDFTHTYIKKLNKDLKRLF